MPTKDAAYENFDAMGNAGDDEEEDIAAETVARDEGMKGKGV